MLMVVSRGYHADSRSFLDGAILAVVTAVCHADRSCRSLTSKNSMPHNQGITSNLLTATYHRSEYTSQAQLCHKPHVMTVCGHEC